MKYAAVFPPPVSRYREMRDQGTAATRVACLARSFDTPRAVEVIRPRILLLATFWLLRIAEEIIWAVVLLFRWEAREIFVKAVGTS